MRAIRSFSVARIVAAIALISAIGTALSAQSDLALAQRQPVICPSATPYPYYNATAASWYCSATATPTVAEMRTLTSVTAGTAAASKALVLDANKAAAGLKVALGGASTSTLAGTDVGGITDTTNATSGTVQNTEYTLNSITLPASAFNATGRGLEVVAWGTLAANANAKNVKIYFGATAVATVTGSTANAKDYLISMRCLRTGSSTQSCAATITIDTGTSATFAVAAPTETDTAAIVIAVKSANTAAAAASASGKGLLAQFLN